MEKLRRRDGFRGGITEKKKRLKEAENKFEEIKKKYSIGE
jgi:hypothetical protein